jgi:hypothetical protein
LKYIKILFGISPIIVLLNIVLTVGSFYFHHIAIGHASKDFLNESPESIVNTTSRLTKIRAGYSFNEASALEQEKKSVTPNVTV